MPNSIAMTTALAPLAAFFDDPALVELRMTRPGYVVLDLRGYGKKEVKAPHLTVAVIKEICQSLSNVSGAHFSTTDHRKSPKLSCTIPEKKHRFECLIGQSVQSKLSLAIRCKHPFTPTWEQVGATPEVVDFLKAAIEGEANILISGATNTGKTTLLNRLLTFLPDDRRVVAAEDTAELEISRFWDGVGLLAARDEDGAKSGMVTWGQMYDHLMRATPDHVIFGEISLTNAFAALAALNSGITGFMCTIHAASPQQALERKFDQNIAWAGRSMPRVSEFLRELIDVVIQIKRSTDGMRRITDIYQPRRDHWVMRDGVMVGRQEESKEAAE